MSQIICRADTMYFISNLPPCRVAYGNGFISPPDARHHVIHVSKFKQVSDNDLCFFFYGPSRRILTLIDYGQKPPPQKARLTMHRRPPPQQAWLTMHRRPLPSRHGGLCTEGPSPEGTIDYVQKAPFSSGTVAYAQ